MAVKNSKKTTAKTTKNVSEKNVKATKKATPMKTKKMTASMKPKMMENNAKVSAMNAEMCATEKTSRTQDWFKLTVVVLLIVNIFASLLMINNSYNTTIDALKAIEAEKVWGSDVYKIWEEVYESPTFKELGRTQAQSMIERLKEWAVQPETGNNEPTAQVPQQISMNDVNKVLEGTYIKGDKNAEYILIEYSDFLCPYCQRQHVDGTVNQLVAAYPTQIKSAFIPNTRGNPTSLKISAAAECAGEQGKFNEFVDTMFNSNPSIAQIETVWATIGLNATTFKKCVDEDKYADKVNTKMQEGSSLFGVRGTPGNVILNTKTGEFVLIAGAYPIDEFKTQFEALMNK